MFGSVSSAEATGGGESRALLGGFDVAHAQLVEDAFEVALLDVGEVPAGLVGEELKQVDGELRAFQVRLLLLADRILDQPEAQSHE